MTAKSIGSIDTWRKYLAVGFPKLQLVDTNDWTWNKTLLVNRLFHVVRNKPHTGFYMPIIGAIYIVFHLQYVHVQVQYRFSCTCTER